MDRLEKFSAFLKTNEYKNISDAIKDFKEKFPLEEEQVEKAIDWLTKKWGKGCHCPYCKNKEHAWSVGSFINIVLSTRYCLVPMFTVTCGNCGHTVLVNVNVMDEDK